MPRLESVLSLLYVDVPRSSANDSAAPSLPKTAIQPIYHRRGTFLGNRAYKYGKTATFEKLSCLLRFVYIWSLPTLARICYPVSHQLARWRTL